MTRYEYTAIPAPFRTEKSKDNTPASDRFAANLTAELNRMAADGWEYIRADVLPSEERSGLTSKTTVYHNLLIFRKEVELREQKHQQRATPSASAVQSQPVQISTEAGNPEPTENRDGK